MVRYLCMFSRWKNKNTFSCSIIFVSSRQDLSLSTSVLCSNSSQTVPFHLKWTKMLLVHDVKQLLISSVTCLCWELTLNRGNSVLIWCLGKLFSFFYQDDWFILWIFLFLFINYSFHSFKNQKLIRNFRTVPLKSVIIWIKQITCTLQPNLEKVYLNNYLY